MGAVMQEIEELLAQGKPSREVIAMGYAPGSVYKKQREMKMASARGRPRHAHMLAMQPLAAGETRIAVSVGVESGLAQGLAHVEPAVACPACGRRSEHWWLCGLCNRLLPADCECGDSEHPEVQGGWTIQQLLASPHSGSMVRTDEAGRRVTT